MLIRPETVKLTPIRHANVPPPMSLHELKIEEDVIGVSTSSSLGILAILTMSQVHLYKYETKSRRSQAPTWVSAIALPPSRVPSQIQISRSGLVVVLTHHEHESRVLISNLRGEDKEFQILEAAERVSSLFRSVDEDYVCLASSSELVVLEKDGSGMKDVVELSEYCPWLEVIVSDHEVNFYKDFHTY
jgi:elongator complex protein 1